MTTSMIGPGNDGGGDRPSHTGPALMLPSKHPRLTDRVEPAHAFGMASTGVTMTYGQIEHLIAAMLRVHDDRQGHLVSRFKLLRRLGFPPGVNVRRGRFIYDRDALLRVVLAFALMDASISPADAVAMLDAEWDAIDGEIYRILRDADLDRAVDDMRDDAGAKRPLSAKFLVLEMKALIHWTGTRTGTSAEDAGNAMASVLPYSVSIKDAEELRQALATARGGRPASSRLVVDLYADVIWAARAVIKAGWATASQILHDRR